MDKKVWNWKKNEKDFWLRPITHCAYLGQRWQCMGKRNILDLGCGLGRNTIYFAKQYGFRMTAVDLSDYAINYLKQAAIEENLVVDAVKEDMYNMPFTSSAFDCVFAYGVTSHLTSDKVGKLIAEINRVVKPGGEIYITMLSKSSSNFKFAKPEDLVDENTLRVVDEDGNEKFEFYVDIDDIKNYFKKFEICDEVVEYNIYNMEKSDNYTKYFGMLLKKR